MTSSPAPEPPPVEVLILNGSPSWWSAEWWIDAGVPALGVAASTLVAAVAIWLTIRQGRSERERRLHESRNLVGNAAFDYLEATRNQIRDQAAYSRLTRSFAATGIDNEPLMRWLVECSVVNREAWQAAAGDEEESPRDYEYEDQEDYRIARSRSRVEIAYLAVTSDIQERLLRWIRTGVLDSEPVQSIEDRL